jgi:hypothetical protein
MRSPAHARGPPTMPRHRWRGLIRLRTAFFEATATGAYARTPALPARCCGDVPGRALPRESQCDPISVKGTRALAFSPAAHRGPLQGGGVPAIAGPSRGSPNEGSRTAVITAPVAAVRRRWTASVGRRAQVPRRPAAPTSAVSASQQRNHARPTHPQDQQRHSGTRIKQPGTQQFGPFTNPCSAT